MKTYKLVLDDETLGVFAISLVENPAVEYDFLYFSKDNKRLSFSIESEEEHIAFGVIMLADTPIYRNNDVFGEHYVVFTKDVIKSITKKFFKNKTTDAITLQHLSPTSGVYMFESYLVDRENGITPPNEFKDIPDGSWVGKFSIENEDVWQSIKDGTFKGFSIEGEFKYDTNETVEIDNSLQFYKDLYKYLYTLNLN